MKNSIAELLNIIGHEKKLKDSSSDFNSVYEYSRKIKLENDEREQKINLKKNWSKGIAITTVLWVLSIVLMMLFLGLDWIGYEKYPYLPQFFVGTFPIVGLCVCVTKHLFPTKDNK